jgi:hypothetical protein
MYFAISSNNLCAASHTYNNDGRDMAICEYGQIELLVSVHAVLQHQAYCRSHLVIFNCTLKSATVSCADIDVGP